MALKFELITGMGLLFGIIKHLGLLFIAFFSLFVRLLTTNLLLDMLARLLTDCHCLWISLILAGSDGKFTHKLHLRIGRVQDI